MDDLWARIQQQNEEMDRQMEERARAQSRVPDHGAYAEQQSHAHHGFQQHSSVEPTALSEAALQAQERELNRQLELERSLARGEAQGQQQRRSSNPGQAGRGGGRLQHSQSAAQKENRGKIPLLPSRPGAPPSSCGGGSGAPRPAPSVAGSVAPSVAGSMAPSLRQPRGVHFTHRMSDKAAPTGQMDDFLNPADGIRGQMRRAGVEPKNHMRENRALIQEMSAVKQQQREVEQYEQQEKHRRDANIRERARQRAQETLADLGAMDISEEGAPPSRGASAGRRSTRPPPAGQEAPTQAARPHEPGKVPAYLQRRKAEWQAAEDAEAERRVREAECPPGTRLVGPEEKAQILDKLATERAKTAAELRSLPFVVKTNATQLKKDQLEARLEEISGAEEAYMREKVFVPADM